MKFEGNGFANQNGNALFLILIAVVLFAALSVALMRSGNVGGNSVSNENMKIEYSRLQNIAASAAGNFHRLHIHGCSDTDFDLDPNPNNAPTGRPACRLFNTHGGPLSTFQAPHHVASFVDYGLTINSASFANVGSSAADYYAEVHFAGPEELCTYINERNGQPVNIYGTDFDTVNNGSKDMCIYSGYWGSFLLVHIILEQ